MRAPWPGSLLVCGLLPILAVLAAACGTNSGEPTELTLEDYFGRLQAISDDQYERDQALGDLGSAATLALLSSDPVGIRWALDDVVLPLVKQYVVALGDLPPPAEVEQAHKDFLEANASLHEAGEQLVRRLASVQSESRIEALKEAEAPKWDEAYARAHDACLALEAIAADHGLELDLRCEAY
jgi:hypothetical protein